MLVIFLDVDGVLNRYADCSKLDTYTKEDYDYFKEESIDEELVAIINHIVRETNAKIVISSAWRYNMDRVLKYLKNAKFEYMDNILGHTGFPRYIQPTNIVPPYDLYNTRRGEQIGEWLEETKHDVEAFVIIDDDVGDILPYYSEDVVIHTNSYTGITMQDAEKAITKLKG